MVAKHTLKTHLGLQIVMGGKFNHFERLFEGGLTRHICIVATMLVVGRDR